jgi:hypothetical protein
MFIAQKSNSPRAPAERNSAGSIYIRLLTERVHLEEPRAHCGRPVRNFSPKGAKKARELVIAGNWSMELTRAAG